MRRTCDGHGSNGTAAAGSGVGGGRLVGIFHDATWENDDLLRAPVVTAVFSIPSAADVAATAYIITRGFEIVSSLVIIFLFINMKILVVIRFSLVDLRNIYHVL